MDWDQYKNRDGVIDLSAAYFNTGGVEAADSTDSLSFIHAVEKLQPIRSRQVAAVIIALCQAFDN